MARTTAEATGLLRSGDPIHALLLDARPDGGAGLDLLEQARPCRPDLPALVLITPEELLEINRICELGAFVLCKTDPPLDALRHVESFVRRATRTARAIRRASERYADAVGLSPRQADVLHCYMEGVARSALADHLGITDHTVRSHVTAILDRRFLSLESLRVHVLATIDDGDHDRGGGQVTPVLSSEALVLLERKGQMTSDLSSDARLRRARHSARWGMSLRGVRTMMKRHDSSCGNETGRHRTAGVVAVALACLGSLWSPNEARAAQCGSFYADNGDNIIILGEASSYFWYEGQRWHIGLGELAICWLDTDMLNKVASPASCDSSSSSSDYVYVSALAGHDILAPNTGGHICRPGYYSTYMLPFDESIFSFYVRADLGTGSDAAYGTENGDTFYSNKAGTIPNLYPADSAEDVLCGCGGDDDLWGDNDDTETYEEILHGGDGAGDYCYGGLDGDYYDWAHTTCNTSDNASRTGTDWGDCGASPPNVWWF